MSAVLAPLEGYQPRTATRAERPALRQVAIRPMKLSRVVFVVVLLTLLGVGMVGVLVLNTTIQERELRVTAAQTRADDLGYRQASLTSQVEQLRSSSDLANRAWAMGLRPNPYPAFVQLGADGRPGRVVGDPTRVSGAEMPDQKFTSADDVTRQIEKARAGYAAREAARLKQEKAAAAQRAAAQAAARAARAAATGAASTTTTSTTTGTGGH